MVQPITFLRNLNLIRVWERSSSSLY